MALLNYTGKNVLGVMLKGGEIVRLLPGINEVDQVQLTEMKAHPQFQSRMNSGLVQIMAEKLGSDGKRSVEDMLSHIPKIVDTKLLRKIIESDGRDNVIRAAQDQLTKIKNPSKSKQEDDGDHFS